MSGTSKDLEDSKSDKSSSSDSNTTTKSNTSTADIVDSSHVSTEEEESGSGSGSSTTGDTEDIIQNQSSSSSLRKNSSVPAALGSICWLNMIPSEDSEEIKAKNMAADDKKDTPSESDVSASGSVDGNENLDMDNGDMKAKLSKKKKKKNMFKSPSATSSCWARGSYKVLSVIQWVFNDFTLRHLVWIKLIFLFQSASMTVLYPYLNLHMKSLGISVQETAIINAVIPILLSLIHI